MKSKIEFRVLINPIGVNAPCTTRTISGVLKPDETPQGIAAEIAKNGFAVGNASYPPSCIARIEW